MIENRKKIMFYESEDTQIKFRIRCQHDGITQSQFLRMAVEAYITGDSSVFELVQRKKEELALQGKNKIKKIKTEKSKQTENIKKFALDSEDVENIFDMIEMETNL